MLKRLLYVVAPLVITLMLVLMMSPNKSNTSLLSEIGTSFQVSVVEINKATKSAGVLINVNQAVNFNHLNQLSIDYIFVVLLAIFVICVVNYRHFKSKTLPPPWYIILKFSAPISLSGWKVSNLLYKSKLLYKF